MPDLTTAQRLAVYRDELVAAGFSASEAWRLVESAAPALPDDVEVQLDIDGRPMPIAEVSVALDANVDQESLKRVAEQIRSTLTNAARGGDGTASAPNGLSDAALDSLAEQALAAMGGDDA